MILLIPINQNVLIQSTDLLKSPKGHCYQVIQNIENDIFRLNPLDLLESETAIDMDFSISLDVLINSGWRKILK